MSTANLLAILAVIGSLAGVGLGAWLTARRQHKQWVLDNKKAEYRELLDLLNVYRFQLLKNTATYSPIEMPAYDAKQKTSDDRVLHESQVSLNNALTDRIFIRKALIEGGVLQQFEEHVRRFDDGEYFSDTQNPSVQSKSELLVVGMAKIVADLRELHQTIVEIAEGDVELT